MNTSKIMATAIICFAFAMSCKETVTPITASKIPNGLSGLIAEQTNLATQKFVVNVEPRKPFKIVGKQGTVITFKNLWNKTTFEDIKGNVDIELIEIYDLADFVLLNKPTVAEDVNSLTKEKKMLESAGSFFVSVKQNGQEVSANYSLASRPNQTVNRDMMIFTAPESTANAEFTWIPTGRKAPVCADSLLIGTYCIDFIEGSIRDKWINLDRYIINDGTNYPIKVQLPSGFNEVNSRVYFSIEGMKTLFPLIYANNIFSTTTYEFQQDLGITIIVIVEDKGELKYFIRKTKTQKNTIETVTTLTPITLEELRQKMNAL